jgi:hypothetical protein
MEPQSSLRDSARSLPMRSYGLSMTEEAGTPHHDAEGITQKLIHDVVVEFYERARRDTQLGPVFEARVDDWEAHLSRMTNFWSAALLRTGRYSGRPVEHHRAIPSSPPGISMAGSSCSRPRCTIFAHPGMQRHFSSAPSGCGMEWQWSWGCVPEVPGRRD